MSFSVRWSQVKCIALSPAAAYTQDWVAVQVPAAHMLCLGWSCDGSQLALGQADGGIAIRSADGVPLGLVNSMAGTPVTSLAWFPSK